MEKNKNMQPLTNDQLNMVSGGGVGEAEAYLSELMAKYHCERWDLAGNMTPEEYNIYVSLYES